MRLPFPDPFARPDGARFGELALELFRLQFAHNPAYRRLCEARKATPPGVQDWTEIPAAPAVAFKELEMTSLPVAQRTRVFYSSGTTEQRPSRHFHSAESLAVYEASLLPWFEAHVLGGIADFRFVMLTPSPERAPHSSLAHMFGTIARTHAPGAVFTGRTDADGAWTVDTDKTLAVLSEATEENRPVVLLGTAFNFVHLLDHLAETGLRLKLPPGSRVMETGGYKGRSRTLGKTELHEMMGEWFGVQAGSVVSEYGMSELGSQAYDWVAYQRVRRRSFHFSPWARARIVSPETGWAVGEGETGLIQIIDLANVWSVLAVQTEDLGIRRGDGFELIGRASLAESRGCSLMSV